MASSITAIRPASPLQPLGPLASFSAVRFRSRRPEAPDPSGSTATGLKELVSQLGGLQHALEALQNIAKSSATSVRSKALARSSASLALNVESTYTTLRSTEQINTTPTSFTPINPSYDGPVSTAQPTIGGTYYGGQGDDTLKFRVRDDRDIGDSGRIRINIRDGANNTIQNLDFDSLPANTPLTLDNGLTLSFGPGTLKKNENFYVDVSTSVGTSVDPTKSFNGTGDNSPRFDSGLSVGAGSFQVSGVSIDVLASDTINSVLSKITASAADVTATFDAVREEVVLTRNTKGKGNNIVLSNDTSGFLAATKLATASPALPRFTTLLSGEEVNANQTSYTPFSPTYDGPVSTAQPFIGGTYFGTQGNDTLKFRVRDDRDIGDSGRIRINIRDGANNTIENLDFDSLPPNTPITLSNGLTLAFGPGTLKKDENFYVDVSTSVGSSVDPTKSFNGTGNDRPGFESGLSVGAGSFEVNGVSIDVLASDTINSVLSKITASAAGVTATFDAGTEKVRLTSTMPGSTEQIVLSNDTSGFVAATKLAELPSIVGGQGDDGVRFISDVTGLSGIGTGSFQINGVSISVDTSSDSLNDVIARINSSGAGATASLDRGADSVTITSTSASTNLVLDDGSSGFFSAVNITPDTSGPRVASGKEAFSNADAVKQRLEEVGRELEAIFSQTFGDVSKDLLDEIRDELRTSISSSFSGLVSDPKSPVVRSGFGIDFNFRDSSERVFDFNVREFKRAANDEFDQVDKFLFRDGPQGTQDGLVGTLIETLKGLNLALADALDSHDGTGLIVDVAV